jgi:EmrB/QacA subfamily drug resistance transporter
MTLTTQPVQGVMAPAAGTGADRYGAAAGRRRWIVLVILCVGQLMIVLDATVVNVALPTIQRELHFSQASLAWVVNAYLITFGGFLLLAGRLGDLIGRRRVLLAGLGAFVVSSMLCGLAPRAGVLVGARFLQGASAAMIAAMVLGIISPMFPEPRERTRALSVFAFVAIGGASLGLVLGGVITYLLTWHWIFFINVPVGVAALLLGKRLIPQHDGIGIRAGADILGAVLVTGAPMLAVYGLVNAASKGWASAPTVGPLVGALALAGLFVAVEARVKTPIVPLRIFRHRNLTSATIVRTLFPMGGFAFNFLAALYFQHLLGFTPLVIGLAFLPSSAITGFFSLAVTPWLLGRCGPKVLVVSGLALITAGLLAFAPVPTHADFAINILPTMLLTGVGFGLMFMPSVSIAMSDVAPQEAGLASGLTNVAVQIGAAIGVAAIATLSTARTKHLLAEHQSVAISLAGGYRAGLLAAAGCTTASLLAAIFLLQPRQPATRPVEASVSDRVTTT